MVLRPRKKTINKNYANYYKDIAKTEREELDKVLNDYAKDDELLKDQMKINSEICNKKHFYLVIGEILLIPFIAILSIMILMIVNK